MPRRFVPRFWPGRGREDVDDRLGRLTERVNQRLPELVPSAAVRPERVHAAMLEALTSPGKRLRPALALAVTEMFGQRSAAVLDLACAVELVHACSLIFDDLPAMDDATLRRGRPTIHRVYGEATAQLAGLALLNRAFGVVAEASQRLSLRRYTVEDLVHHLSAAVGSDGLVGGQALDLAATPAEHDLALLEYIHSHKTGALFIAAGELGAMAADARRRDLETITRFAKNLGLAFQITDDLIDATLTPDEAGKDTGRDVGKVTFVSLLGVEGAGTLADELLDFAVATLEPLGRAAEPLRQLAGFVKRRGR